MIGLHSMSAATSMPRYSNYTRLTLLLAYSQYRDASMDFHLLPGAVAPGSHPAASNEFRTELAQAKRREAEASTRVAALEAKLKSSSSGFGEMQTTIQELTHRVQVCADKSSL